MSLALIQEAELAFKRGDLARVEKLCSEILLEAPANPPATLLTGLVAIRKGNHVQAEEWLNKALTLSPDDYIALLWLPIALRALGKPLEAIQVGERSRSLWPDNSEVLGSLALDYFNVKDYSQAEECLLAAIRAQPRNPSLHRKLGSLYEVLGRDSEAGTAYQKAIDAAPTNEEGYAYWGRLLIGHGNFTQAIELCERALRMLPNSAQIHLVFAQALRGVRELERAETHLKQAISIDPNIVLAAALWLNEDGRFSDAAELFRQSIQQRPVQGIAYFGLIKGKKTTEADSELIARMQALVAQDSLPPKEVVALHYALGKAADDLHRYEEAMTHYDAANRLKYRIYLEGKSFDLNQAILHRKKTESMFTKEFLASRRKLSSSSNVPIFIIGMIRSGTTLLEQIVASHPDVGGAGEQRFWTTELPAIVDLEAQTLDSRKFEEARERYIRVLRSLQPNSPRITDKMPMNFYCAGILHLAFPNSPILHIRRNPVDTALSIYMTDLAKPPEFAHNKRNIVSAYREYEEIMKLWRAVIPRENLLEINYEDLIAEQETWTRQIIDFCGLEWNDSCMEFYKDDRQVSTPSMWQVRQPIYKTSVEKWRNYEPWLGELGDLL